MKKTKKDLPQNLAIAYARVSSKEQEKEGFSIAAQQRLLQSYALDHQLVIEKEYIDVETAKTSGRTAFTEMLAYLKKHPHVRTILVEKTDRLYRNLKDWTALDELDIAIHLVKENITLSRESRSTEKFVHGIKVLMAKNYCDNLSEEASKGMLEKAAQGIWPTKAPLGYVNCLGPEGKRIIAVDPRVAPIVSKCFEWYADGLTSLSDVAKKAHQHGLTYKRSGAAVPRSAIHTMLRNRLYTGEFDWKGKRYQGKHAPLVSVELFEKVQQIIDGRFTGKTKESKKDFAFASLVHCGHCGCALSGDLKKGKYIYYRCSGWKGKCNEPYVREEVLAGKFSDLLGRLKMDDAVLGLVSRGLRESHADQNREHREAVSRFQTEYDRLQARVHAIYLDKLDGRIDNHFFDKLSEDFRRQQSQCLREIARHQSADQSYIEEGVGLLEMARDAQHMFAKQPAAEKRRLLGFVLSNSTWANGHLNVTLREPFDLVAEMNAAALSAAASGSQNLSDCPEWLGD